MINESVFKTAAIERIQNLIDSANESFREYTLEHDDSPIREFVAGCSYGEAVPDWKEVKDRLENDLFDRTCNTCDIGAFEVLAELVDGASDGLKEQVVTALVELAEVTMEGIYNPSGAILNSAIVGEIENQVPDEARELIESFGVTKADLNLEYYIDKELKYSYMDCSYDVCRLILDDTEAVIGAITVALKEAL